VLVAIAKLYLIARFHFLHSVPLYPFRGLSRGYNDVKDKNVRGGDITCRDNDRLDSTDNDAVGGSVNCSKSLFD
jgi:hypothetical protein